MRAGQGSGSSTRKVPAPAAAAGRQTGRAACMSVCMHVGFGLPLRPEGEGWKRGRGDRSRREWVWNYGGWLNGLVLGQLTCKEGAQAMRMMLFFAPTPKVLIGVTSWLDVVVACASRLSAIWCS